MRKIDYGTYTFDLPDQIIHHGKKYDLASSYTWFKDIAKMWAEHTNMLGVRHQIVKMFPSNEVVRGVGRKKLYVLYKRTIKEWE